MDFTADLALFYSDFGQPATLAPQGGGAAVTGAAILDLPGTTVVDGQLLATDYSLRFPLATFPAIKRGDTVVVGGASYTVREGAQLIGVDGLEAIVALAKP